MARIKFGSVIVSGNGSLSGHSFQNSKAGSQMNTKVMFNKTSSTSQSRIKYTMAMLRVWWRSLEPDQRNLWLTFASSPHDRKFFTSSGRLSAYNLFIKMNWTYFYNYGLILIDPNRYGLFEIGADQISNPNFHGQSPWDFQSSWQYNFGYAHYLDDGNTDLRLNQTFQLNTRFQLRFRVFDAVSFLRLYIINHAGTPFFKTPYNSARTYYNGLHVIEAECALTTTYFRIRGYTAGSIGNITDIHLVPLYPP